MRSTTLETITPPAALQVEAGGRVVRSAEQEPPGSAELIGLGAAVIILLVAFGSVVAMAVHAKRFASGASSAAADLGIRYHLQGLTDFPKVKGAAFIATADGRNKLGVTALRIETAALPHFL